MKLFWTGIAKVLFYVISGALLIYAASRSLDFITATLAPGQRIIGYLGLAATSGGMIAWLMLFLYSAEGIGQRITAGIMTVLDMVGEFGLFTMDTLYQSGQSGMTAKLMPDEIKMVVIALSALIAINILATVLYHLLEPENMKRMRESSIRDQLESKTLKEIEMRGDELARKLAPQIAKEWADQFEMRFAHMQSLGLGVKDDNKDKTASPQPEPTLAKTIPVSAAANSKGQRCPKCRSLLLSDGFCPTCEDYITAKPNESTDMRCLECGKLSGQDMFCSKACEAEHTRRSISIQSNRLATLEEAVEPKETVPLFGNLFGSNNGKRPN